MKKLIFIALVALLVSSASFAQSIIHKERGNASFYADKFQGHKTANGESYDRYAMTAAHRKLPFGTLIKVTNLKNKAWVVLRVNDRGPFSTKRMLDVSRAAAIKLDMVSAGSADIELEVIGSSETNPKPGATGSSQSSTSTANVPKTKEATYDLTGKTVYPKGLGIQLGSYSDLALAQKQANAAFAKGLRELYIQASIHDGRMVYRVLYSNRDENGIRALLPQVKNKGFSSAFVRPHIGHL